MAKIKEKKQVNPTPEPPKDAFQSGGAEFADKLSSQMQSNSRNILIGLGVLVALVALFGLWRWNSNRKAAQGYAALGQGFKADEAQVSASPIPGVTTPVYATEKEKAQKTIEAFQAAAGQSDPTGAIARYMIAVKQLEIDRAQGLSQLQQLTGSSEATVAVLSKFALAQAYEVDAKNDEAAKLYSELAAANNQIITPDTANLRLAAVYDKQGKTKEAVDLLFNLAKAARERKDKDGKAVDPSSAAREAEQELQRLDPKRYAELPKTTPEAA